MEALKPCPFCRRNSGAVKLRNMYVENGRGLFIEEYEAVCINCGANTGRIYKSSFCRRNGEFVFVRDGYAAAVADWNRREEPPVQDDRSEEGE